MNSQNLFDSPQQLDFFDCSLDKLIPINSFQSNKTTLLLLNPPYGLRLGKKTSQTMLYQRIAMKVSEIYQHLHSKRSEVEISNGDVVETPILMGYCICSNELTSKEFIKGITNDLSFKFFTETHSFSHGGKERLVVSFRSV
jgi:hypothetical protein